MTAPITDWSEPMLALRRAAMECEIALRDKRWADASTAAAEAEHWAGVVRVQALLERREG